MSCDSIMITGLASHTINGGCRRARVDIVSLIRSASERNHGSSRTRVRHKPNADKPMVRRREAILRRPGKDPLCHSGGCTPPADLILRTTIRTMMRICACAETYERLGASQVCPTEMEATQWALIPGLTGYCFRRLTSSPRL